MARSNVVAVRVLGICVGRRPRPEVAIDRCSMALRDGGEGGSVFLCRIGELGIVPIGHGREIDGQNFIHKWSPRRLGRCPQSDNVTAAEKSTSDGDPVWSAGYGIGLGDLPS